MSKLELGKMITVSLTASHLEIYANLIDMVATVILPLLLSPCFSVL